MLRTFELGGYYRVDLNDKVSVLSINTLYYDSERKRRTDTQGASGHHESEEDSETRRGVDQMFWLAK